VNGPTDLARAARKLAAALQRLPDAGPSALAQQFAFARWLERDGVTPGSSLAAAVTLCNRSRPPELLAALAEVEAAAARCDAGSTAAYERFLAAFDAAERRACGAFYTPDQVVRAQVRWADQLVREAGFGDGLSTPGVITLDPAAGTGAYLLAAAELSPQARLVGRELMPGPYAVAESLLPTASLTLGDTLSARFEEPGAELLVCLGNPPYARGDATHPGIAQLLAADAACATRSGHGGDVKNLYNLYAAFWSWAIREVFELRQEQPGLISFVTASSFLNGDAFVGLRQRLRRCCELIWVVDLGGEGRSGRQSANVFPIQSPVAITVAFRRGAVRPDVPAEVHYHRVDGDRSTKLAALDAIPTLADLTWGTADPSWQAPLMPKAADEYLAWPALTDLFPWQHSGVQPKRTWPIAPDRETLSDRWQALLQADDRATAMRASADRSPDRAYAADPRGGPAATPLNDLPEAAPTPTIVPYAMRSFDTQWLLADGRLLSRPRPALWQAHSPRQRYFATSLSLPLGKGPALTVSAAIPDLHVFCGRGAKDIIPFYQDADGLEPNVAPGLLHRLAECYGQAVTVDDLAGYTYGILASPGYTARFHDALTTSPPHLPLTADRGLYADVAAAGSELMRLHLERSANGRANCAVPVPQATAAHPAGVSYDDQTEVLRVGEGIFERVAPAVMTFEVSGLRAVGSWLGYRLAMPKGRRDAPLDQVIHRGWPPARTDELLRLLWTIEATLARYPFLDDLLSRVLAGPLLRSVDLLQDAQRPFDFGDG